MLSIKEFLTFEHQSEHQTEHSLKKTTNYTEPKIYIANGNLKERWYVYFKYVNPDTGRLKRQPNIYVSNKLKTKEERLHVLSHYRRELLKLLKEGFNPHEDNSHLLKGKEEEKFEVKPKKVTKVKVETPPKSKGMSVLRALNKALEVKEKTLSARAKQDYSYKVKAFMKWLKKEQPQVKTVDLLSLNIIHDYLDYIYETTSARNRNNYRTELGSIMQTLEDRGIIKKNFMQNIKPLKTKPQMHERYSEEDLNKIFKHLQENDPILLLYIKFVSYTFTRPIEACRVTIGDMNFKEKTFKFQAKNQPLKTKIIPEILLKELPDLSNKNDDMYLFTPNEIGAYWDAAENT